MTKDDQAASYLRALGHPIRLNIAKELLKGPKSVGEVERTLNIGQANTSQHLTLLRINGIVDWIRKGNIKEYSLMDPKRIRIILNAIEIDMGK